MQQAGKERGGGHECTHRTVVSEMIQEMPDAFINCNVGNFFSGQFVQLGVVLPITISSMCQQLCGKDPILCVKIVPAPVFHIKDKGEIQRVHTAQLSCNIL